jgi:hypothetical protein
VQLNPVTTPPQTPGATSIETNRPIVGGWRIVRLLARGFSSPDQKLFAVVEAEVTQALFSTEY